MDGKIFTETFGKNGSTLKTTEENETWNWGTEQEEDFGKIKQIDRRPMYRTLRKR